MAREMKDSGIEWIGKIPNKWKRTYLLNLLKCSITDGPHETPNYVQNGIPFISVDSLNDTENVNLDIVKKFISNEDYDEYNKKTNLKKGDILFSKSATIGKTAIVDERKYMVWSPLAVIKCNDKYVFNKYIYYVLNCNEYIISASNLGTKNTQINVGMRSLEKSYIPVPPLLEQRRIANFLDEKVKEIDEVIKKTKETIELYKKYKQAIIAEVVTKGLDKNVKMKDSGIEWIGKIPEDWKLKPIKYNYRLIPGATPKSNISEYWDGGINWITPADFKTDDIYVLKGSRTISKLGYESCSTTMIPSGSLIFTKRAPIGTVAINKEELCTNQGCLGLVGNNAGIINKYYYYTISVYPEVFDLYAAGTTFREISTTAFGNVLLPCPSKQTQEKIVKFLDSKCSEINGTIVDKKKQLETLEAYKKSLIYEYVTGKKEVK